VLSLPMAQSVAGGALGTPSAATASAAREGKGGGGARSWLPAGAGRGHAGGVSKGGRSGKGEGRKEGEGAGEARYSNWPGEQSSAVEGASSSSASARATQGDGAAHPTAGRFRLWGGRPRLCPYMKRTHWHPRKWTEGCFYIDDGPRLMIAFPFLSRDAYGNLTNEEDLLRVADESEAFTLLQWAVYKQKWRWCETYGEAALFLDGTHCVAPLAGGKKGGGVTAHEQQKPSIDAKRTLGTILLV
jgi:hypothetical protein